MAILSNRLKPETMAPRRPRTAVEVAPEGALSATLPRGAQSPVYAFCALPLGALVPGIAEANLRMPEAVAEALRTALDAVSPSNRAVTLIVPDTAVRVFILDFDSLSDKPAEALQVLRFRLRKMVPFDVEHASVSYQRLANGHSPDEAGIVRVLTAVMPGPILTEYETAVRAAGYEPGAILPSSLASLAATDAIQPILAVNLGSSALTTAVTSGENLLLYRTVELPPDDAGRLAEVQRSVAVTAAYYEDKLSAPARTLHYAGAVDVREFARAISDASLDVVEISPAPSTGTLTAMGPIGFAGVNGALAEVA